MIFFTEKYKHNTLRPTLRSLILKPRRRLLTSLMNEYFIIVIIHLLH